MNCNECGREIADYVFFCPVCGLNLIQDSYHRSAFCWGGDGCRHHTYRYPGMNISVIVEKQLPAQASYPVHWKQWLFYAYDNSLVVSMGDQEQTLVLSPDSEQAYLPIIAPPFLYLLPGRQAVSPLKINIISLIDAFQANNLHPGMIQEAGGPIQIHAHLAPAVWFDPLRPNALQLIAFWASQDLLLWDLTNSEISSIYRFHGLLSSNTYTPCFDDRANLWLSDNANHTLIEFKRENGYQPQEHHYQGILSAPIWVRGAVYFYRTEAAGYELTKHPHHPVTAIGRINPEQFPQHISSNGAEHPGYLAAAKLTEAAVTCELNPRLRSYIHPVWIQRNNFNAMILAHQ